MSWHVAWYDGDREWAGCILARGWWLVGREGGKDASVEGPFDSKDAAEERLARGFHAPETEVEEWTE